MSTAGAIRMRKWRARQYAAGKHFIKGKVVDTPRVQPSQRTTYPADDAFDSLEADRREFEQRMP